VADEPTPTPDEPPSVPGSATDGPMPEGEKPSSASAEQQGGESSVSEPPTPDAMPPEKKHRSNEFWLAALGMAGTLLAGIAGGVATYVTGVQHDNHDTASAAASFTRASISAQASFTRSQQVEAYTAFLSAISDFSASWLAAIQDLTHTYAESHHSDEIFPVPGWKVPAKYDVATSQWKLEDARERLTIFTSKEVDAAAVKVWKLADDMVDWYDHLKMDPENAHPSLLQPGEVLEQVRTDNIDLNDDRQKFLCAVRKDLGSPPGVEC
jgi:hypothetical protein